MTQLIEKFMEKVASTNPGQPEFHQAVREVAGESARGRS